MNYLLPIVELLIFVGVSYAVVSKRRTPVERAAFAAGIMSVFPLLDGGLMLWTEYGRMQQGRVTPGVVTEKLSTTGEAGSVTIGRRLYRSADHRRPTIVTSKGFQVEDELARVMLTGSRNAWFVEYRYPCDLPNGCWEREAVSHELWSSLRVGQTVGVRFEKGRDDDARLDANPQWSGAIARLAMGSAVALFAYILSSGLSGRRRTLVTVPAVVTALEPMTVGGKVQWRVRFAYRTADGTAYEGADEVYGAGVRAGDSCLAVYPADQPQCGMLRLSEQAAG